MDVTDQWLMWQLGVIVDEFASRVDQWPVRYGGVTGHLSSKIHQQQGQIISWRGSRLFKPLVVSFHAAPPYRDKD